MSNTVAKSMVLQKPNSDLMNSYRTKFDNGEVTIALWNEICSKLPADVIRKEFFSDRRSYLAFCEEMKKQDLQVSSVSENDGKILSMTDHHPVFSTNKVSIGSPNVESEINSLYANHLRGMDLDEGQIKEIISIILSVKTTDEAKAKEQTMKVIRRYCTQNNLPAELSNALGMRAMKVHNMVMTKLARNIGEAIIETDEKKKLKAIKRLFVGFCDAMGVEYYEAGCLLIGNGES